MHDPPWARFACQLTCCAAGLRAGLRHAAQQEGLLPADAQLLLALQQSPAAMTPQRRLPGLAGLTPAQTSLRLEALRQRGAVTSERCAADRRRLRWGLLDDGRELAGRLVRHVRASLTGELEVAALRELATSLAMLLSSDQAAAATTDTAPQREEAA